MAPNHCLAVDSVAPPESISWDRASAAPGGIVGVWSAGFITNRRELRAQVGADDRVSDLDLAKALYSRWGKDAPRHIHGSFAWIVWDGGRQCLLAIRDRAGIHEILYRQDGDTIHLAGGIEPLLVSRSRAGIDPLSVLAHIHGRAPATGHTFYQGIGAVAPGNILTVTRDRIESDRYWRPEALPVLRLADDDSYGRAFNDLFLPIAAEYAPAGEAGVTLSGGLDSTTVAAAIRESSLRTDLTAFSWTAPELPEADESEAIAAVCRRLRCRLVSIAADRHWPLRSEPGIRTEPATPFFNYYTDLWEATFRSVRQHGVRVLFSGLSGDHLFGANAFSYPDLLLTGRWRRLVREIRDHRRHSEMSVAEIVRWLALAPIANAYVPGRDRDRTRPVSWLGPRLRQEVDETPVSRRLLPGRRQRLRLLRDPRLAAIASLVTRQAARHGIDFRHPLLDHRLFEFAAALPTTQTFAAGQRKIVLRNAMRGRLPETVRKRRDRTYMTAIARRGLGERERTKAWALMTDMRAAQMGYVDERRLRAAYAAYLAGGDENALFWNTLTLEAWLRQHFS